MSVALHPSLILWLSVLFYLDGALLLPFLVAAALHELGHYLTLRYMGRPPNRVVLNFSGARMETPPLSYRQELLAAAAGPMVSLLLGLVWPLWPALGLYSLILGCFNLLPIPELDGSRILRCALLLCLPAQAVYRISKYAAILTALAFWGGAVYLAVHLHFGVWPLILAALLLYKALIMDLDTA